MAENNCSQTLAGLARDCSPSMGGVRRLLIANRSDIKTVTAELGLINTITMEASAKFAEYRFQPETAYFTTTQTVALASGTNYYVTEIGMMFKRMDTTKRTEIQALGLNELAVIAEDNNGKFWYFGKDEAVFATGGESGTGTARGDANKYGLILTDNSKELPYEVSAEIIDSLLKPAL